MSFASRSPKIRSYGVLLVLTISGLALLSLYKNSELLSVHGDDPTWSSTAIASGHKTPLHGDPPPDEGPFGAIVAAARSTEDLSWTIFVQKEWTLYIYDVDNPQNPDSRLRIPMNKGHEAMVYLSHIIDNYDELPWSVVFVHGHREAWHQQDDIARLIKGLNRVVLAREGYISMRCDWYPSCPAEIRPRDHDAVDWGPALYRKESEVAIAGNWKLLFPGEKLPSTIASQCCAQFAVTRQAIWRRPRSDYDRLRQWLIETQMVDDVSGRVLEKLWAFIFTGDAVHCPPPQQCACEYFEHQCSRNKWSQPPKGLSPLPKWPA